MSKYKGFEDNAMLLKIVTASRLADQADAYLNKNVGPATDNWGVWDVDEEIHEKYPEADVIVAFRYRKHMNMFKLWCELNSIPVIWESDQGGL